MLIDVAVLLGLCGAELDVALCDLAVRSAGAGWLTDEPFSLPSLFSVVALGCPATNWNALSFAFACDVAGTGGLRGAVTFVVSPRVVLFWFLCQLPGLGWRKVSTYCKMDGAVFFQSSSVSEADMIALITSNRRMEDKAHLTFLVLFKEAGGARRHWLRGKWWRPMLIV
jgi:hypothetical protein